MSAKSLVFTLTFLISCVETKEKKELLDKNPVTTFSSDSLNIENSIFDSLDDYLNIFFPNNYQIDEENTPLSKKDSLYYVEQILKILNTKNIDNIDATKSKDGNIIIFSQEQETGGSASVVNHIIAYKSQNNSYKVLIPFNNEEAMVINITPAWIENIYKLPCKKNNLYLVIGGGIGNNAFNYSLASVIELNKGDINFNYPAFEYRDSSSEGSFLTSKSSFTIDYSNRSLEDIVFVYDTIKSQIIYKYPYFSYNEKEQEKEVWISKKLRFNGKKFNGFVY
jgi:hypothetical protein